MQIDQLYPSRFLRCADLHGKPVRVVIDALKRENIGGEAKVILSFAGGSKSLILNKTNARVVARALGNETDEWRGKSIVLMPTEVDFKGDLVPAIRVKAVPQPTAAPADEDPFVALDGDPDDEILNRPYTAVRLMRAAVLNGFLEHACTNGITADHQLVSADRRHREARSVDRRHPSLLRESRHGRRRARTPHRRTAVRNLWRPSGMAFQNHGRLSAPDDR